MIRYKSSRQLSISEFKMPFEAKLDENNRWVVLSKIVPWEDFAQLYYKNFKSNRGAPTKDARLVLGVIIIKHIMKSDDRGVIEMIQEGCTQGFFECVENEEKTGQRVKKSDTQADQLPETGCTDYLQYVGHHKG